MRVSRVFNQSDQIPLLIKTLAVDKRSDAAFEHQIDDELAQAREHFESSSTTDISQTDFALPIFEAFAQKTDPTYQKSDKGYGSGQHIDWITKIYTQRANEDKPIRSEDLSRLSRQISYFSKAKAALKEAGQNTNLEDYATYEAFNSVISPMYMKYLDKLQKGVGVPDKVKEQTSVLYDGPEGKVVLPHDVRASQFWGQGTMWCISERDEWDTDFWADDPEFQEEITRQYERHPFHGYNHSPVIIYAPKRKTLDAEGVISGKIAVVANEIYNEQDDVEDTLPPYILALRQAALDHAPHEDARKYLEHYGTARDMPDRTSQAAPEDGIKHRFDHLPKEQQEILDFVQTDKNPDIHAIFKEHSSLFKQVDFVKAMITVDATTIAVFNETLRNNKDFALLAASLNGLTLRDLGHDAKRDKDVVMTALEQNGLAMQFAHPQFKEDPDAAITAMTQNFQALNFIDPSLRKNRDFIIRGMQVDMRVIEILDHSLFEDDTFVLDLLEIAEQVDENDRMTIMGQLHRVPSLWGHMTDDLAEMRKAVEAAQTNEDSPAAPVITSDLEPEFREDLGL